MLITDVPVQEADSNFFVLPVRDRALLITETELLNILFPQIKYYTEKKVACYKNEVLGVGIIKFVDEMDFLRQVVDIKEMFPESRISVCYPTESNELLLLAYYTVFSNDITVHINKAQISRLQRLCEVLKE